MQIFVKTLTGEAARPGLRRFSQILSRLITPPRLPAPARPLTRPRAPHTPRRQDYHPRGGVL